MGLIGSYNYRMYTVDVAYLLFGQAMPQLDDDARYDITDFLRDGDYDLALDALIQFIDKENIQVDEGLLEEARKQAPKLIKYELQSA